MVCVVANLQEPTEHALRVGRGAGDYAGGQTALLLETLVPHKSIRSCMTPTGSQVRVCAYVVSWAFRRMQLGRSENHERFSEVCSA